MDSLLACATCANNFADENNAPGYAILFMLAVIVPMMAGVIFCMIRIARRGRTALEPELRDDFDPSAPVADPS